MAHLKLLSQYSPGKTEKHHEIVDIAANIQAEYLPNRRQMYY
jgi:hypothetical protein